jgi:hypothetical protein
MGCVIAEVRVCAETYRIMRAPEPIIDDDGDRWRSEIDHEQRIIWIDPAADAPSLPRVVGAAVAQAWFERTHVPLVT